MIYLKTSVVDGVFKVNCYDESGVDKTSDFTITSKIYRKEQNNEYTFLLETSEKVLELHPDVFETLDYLYVTVLLDNQTYKTYLKTLVKNQTTVLKYTILYKSQTPLVEVSTPFLDRFSYFMPRWSTAYKNDVSNFSKITYPLFANIEKAFFKTSEIVTKSLANKTTFKKILTPRQRIGKVLGQDGVERKFTYNIQNSPITRIKTEESFARLTDMKEIAVDTFKDPISFKKNLSTLFITSPLNSTVTFSGITEAGTPVTESFTFNTLVTKQSRYKYKKLFYVDSTTTDSYIRNYVDCTDIHLIEKEELLPAFVDSSKEQQFPSLLLDGKTLSVRYVKDGLFEYDANSYNLVKDFKSVFVTDTLDVIGLSTDNTLYTSILRKNIEVDMPLLNNNNNNDYVYVSSVSSDSISFKIKTDAIVSDLKTDVVTVEVRTDKGTYYIDSTTEQFTEQPVNYFLSTVNALEFSLGIIDIASFVSVIVSTPTNRYQASYRLDNLTMKPQETNIDALYYFGDSVYALKGTKLLKLSLLKDYYEIDNNGSLIFYENNLTVYSMKGDKIDG